MLKVPDLDDLGFQRLFETARSQIPTLTNEWTDFNYHDPGITMLHTFAWLADMLNYYINATGEAHRLKYLKLLGLQPQSSPARCVLALNTSQEKISLPKGACIAAGGIPFETEKNYHSNRNRLISLRNECGDTIEDILPFAGSEGGFARIFTDNPQQESAVYFGFERRLEEETRIYMEVYQGFRRNPFQKGFSLSDCVWECYADGGWQQTEILEDETCGFLRNGFVSLLLPEPTSLFRSPLLPRAHYLRCKLVRNDYDIQPRIGRVIMNCVEAVQTKSYAHLIETVSDGGNFVDIDFCVCEKDSVLVAVKEGKQYHLCYRSLEQKSRCSVDPDTLPGRKTIHFSVPPVSGQELMIAVIKSGYLTRSVLGVTNGCANQRFSFDLDGVLDLKLALAEPSDSWDQRLTIWRMCDDISSATFDDPVFIYRSGQIIFGDGIHGLQPDSGLLVIAVHVQISLFSQGNVLKGQVTDPLDSVFPEYLQVQNIDDAHGGIGPENSKELSLRLKKHLLESKRAVNHADFYEIVMNAPGLAIDSVNVVSMEDYCKFRDSKPLANTVVLAVKPYSDNKLCPRLSENYRRILQEYLEGFRMLTTNIRIVSAEYAAVEIYGRIRLTEKTQEAVKAVAELLQEKIDFRRTRRFGDCISYAEIFSSLEMLKYVRSVEQISFDAAGSGIQKNSQGDILLPPDSLLYIRKTEIEYV